MVDVNASPSSIVFNQMALEQAGSGSPTPPLLCLLTVYDALSTLWLVPGPPYIFQGDASELSKGAKSPPPKSRDAFLLQATVDIYTIAALLLLLLLLLVCVH